MNSDISASSISSWSKKKPSLLRFRVLIKLLSEVVYFQQQVERQCVTGRPVCFVFFLKGKGTKAFSPTEETLLGNYKFSTGAFQRYKGIDKGEWI